MSIFTESYKKAKSKLYETIDLPCEDGGVLVVSRRNADEALSIMQEENHDLRTQLAKANEEYKSLFEIFESCQARMLRYKSAIDEECVLWDFTVDEKNPRKSIQRLLDITDAVARDPDVNSKARKFAIEKKCEGYYDYCVASGMNGGQADLLSDIYAEQLRKEQKS